MPVVALSFFYEAEPVMTAPHEMPHAAQGYLLYFYELGALSG